MVHGRVSGSLSLANHTSRVTAATVTATIEVPPSENGHGAEPTIAAIKLTRLERVIVEIPIIGETPLIVQRWSEKAKQLMLDAQQAKTRKKKDPKDPNADYEAASYRHSEGWYGIPASAFRNAMISACRTVGYQMTRARLAAWLLPDGYMDDGSPLVRITSGAPRRVVHHARNDDGSVDLRARAMWAPGWEAVVRVQFDED